jgi:Flp pilus assembly protein TadD
VASASLVALLLLGAASPATRTSDAPEAAATDHARFDLLRYRDRVEADGTLTRTVEMQVLLQTAAGVEEFGQIAWPYVSGLGEIEFDEVTIGKADGRRIQVTDAPVEDINPFGVTGLPIVPDLRFKKLTVPGLETGDRLSYRVVVHQKPITPGSIAGEMTLPAMPGEPEQVYELDIPRDAGIRDHLRDGLEAGWEEVPSPRDRLVRRLTLAVKRSEDEKSWLAALLGRAAAGPDVMYANFASWAEVARWWWALARDRVVPDASVKRQASQLVTPEAAPREKIEALYGFVASRVRYLSVGFGLGRMRPRPAGDVLASRYGDCKDKHALLAALASSVGVDVRPVLISTAHSDLVDEVPGPQQFDHMISVARLGPDPSDWLWLDSTSPFSVPGYLVPELRDKRALLIEASGPGEIVRTPADPPFPRRMEVEIKGELQADGALSGHVTWRFRSDPEVYFRSVWAAIAKEKLAPFVKGTLAQDWDDAEVTNIVAADPTDVSRPFQVGFDVKQPAPAQERKSPTLSIPLPNASVPEGDGETVELKASEFVARADISMAEGLSAHAPLSLSLARPYGRFESSYAVEGRHLTVARTVTLSRKTLSGEDLPGYAAFRKAIDNDHDQEFAIAGEVAPTPAVTAASLHADGRAALDKKDYAKAIELLRAATEADRKVENGFLDLGRALDGAGREAEAVEAFSRQIEVDPFHESAYAWRAYVLESLDRWDEAEKDLLKQIEVAPFEAWSYQQLANRRTTEGRHHEAADFYSRAAAVDPGKPGRWVDLAWAQARDGHPQEARTALERARALDLPDWMKISAAGAYARLGDPTAGADLAREGLVSMEKRLAALAPGAAGDGDLWRTEYLARGWSVLGADALARKDTAAGERYLQAAWRLAFWPEAAWALGDLREKQGRAKDAARLWSMAAAVPSANLWLPADSESRLAGACPHLEESASPLVDESLVLMRAVEVKGPAIADLTEEVLLLTDQGGRVEVVRNLSRKDPEGFDRQIAKLAPIRLDFSSPDAREFKAPQRGLLTCSRTTGTCALILDVPGLPRLSQAVLRAGAARDFGTIEIVRLTPPDGSTVKRGQHVDVVAVVRYDLQAEKEAVVTLVIQDETHHPLLVPQPQAPVAEGTGDVTLTGSFEVPAEGSQVDIYLPLGGPDTGTTTAASAHYPIE